MINPSEEVAAELESARIHYDNCAYDKAVTHYERALVTAQAASDQGLVGHILTMIGLTHRVTGQYVMALAPLRQAYERLAVMSKEDQVTASCELATVLNRMGDPQKAQTILTDMTARLESPRDNRLLIECMSTLAGVHQNIGDLRTDIQMMENVLVLSRAEGYRIGEMKALANLGNSHSWCYEFPVALQYIDEALTFIDDSLSPYDVANLYMIAASINSGAGNSRSAGIYLRKAYQIARKHGLQLLVAMALMGLLHQYYSEGRLDEAIKMGLRAEKAYLRTTAVVPEVYRDLSSIYKRKGDFASAYDYLQKFVDAKLKLMNEERQKSIAEMQARFDLERAEREAGRLRQELELKENQISSTALHLVSKREVISSTVARLRRIDSPKGEKGDLRMIIRELSGKLDDEPSWDLLEQQFNHVHSNFLPSLLKRFPSITPVESRICILTRLNLDTKHIASLLSIDPRTVQNHRLRIRRKLGVSGQENLSVFLSLIT